MKHEFRDFVRQEDIDEVAADPRFKAYKAGFDKAKELYAYPNPSELSYVTSPIDHFLWWKEQEDAGSKRVDL